MQSSHFWALSISFHSVCKSEILFCAHPFCGNLIKFSFLRLPFQYRPLDLHGGHWWCCFLRVPRRSYFSLRPFFAVDVTWLCPPPFFPGMCSVSTAPPLPSHQSLAPSISKVLSFLFLIPTDFFMEVKLCRGNFLKNWAQRYYIEKNLLAFRSSIWQNKFPGAIVTGQSAELFKTQPDKVMVHVLAGASWFQPQKNLKDKKTHTTHKKIFLLNSVFSKLNSVISAEII